MGIPVRVHFLFFLFVTFIFAVQSNHHDLVGTAFVTTGCLIICVLLHELAHVFALTNLGGHVNSIVFTPWGGNSDFSLPEPSRSRAIVYLAGPFFSGCLFALGACLLIQTGNARFSDLIIPFRPAAFVMSNWEVSLLRIATWVNFQLFFVNLIPCFPFDGAGIVRAVIDRITEGISIVRRESTLLVLGQATGLTLIGCGWFLSGYEGGPVRPVWFVFVASGICLLFSARHSYFAQITMIDDEWDDVGDADYDSIYGDASFFDFPEEETDNYSQWLIEKQEERDRAQRDQEDREAKVADEILQKLHNDGIESLTDEEKGILNRVSARIRRRKEQKGVDL
jgi:Zn-dependent protease